jgi:hypothetical protein
MSEASPIGERRGGQQRGHAVNRGDDGKAVQQGARMTT